MRVLCVSTGELIVDSHLLVIHLIFGSCLGIIIIIAIIIIFLIITVDLFFVVVAGDASRSLSFINGFG